MLGGCQNGSHRAWGPILITPPRFQSNELINIQNFFSLMKINRANYSHSHLLELHSTRRSSKQISWIYFVIELHAGNRFTDHFPRPMKVIRIIERVGPMRIADFHVAFSVFTSIDLHFPHHKRHIKINSNNLCLVIRLEIYRPAFVMDWIHRSMWNSLHSTFSIV